MQTDSEENADVALTTADELAEIQNGVEQLQLTQNASMVDADSFGAMRAGLAELSIGS